MECLHEWRYWRGRSARCGRRSNSSPRITLFWDCLGRFVGLLARLVVMIGLAYGFLTLEEYHDRHFNFLPAKGNFSSADLYRFSRTKIVRLLRRLSASSTKSITSLGMASLNQFMSRLWGSRLRNTRSFFTGRLLFLFGFTGNRLEIFEPICWSITKLSLSSRLGAPLKPHGRNSC